MKQRTLWTCSDPTLPLSEDRALTLGSMCSEVVCPAVAFPTGALEPVLFCVNPGVSLQFIGSYKCFTTTTPITNKWPFIIVASYVSL